jgi:hypothetical protein
VAGERTCEGCPLSNRPRVLTHRRDQSQAAGAARAPTSSGLGSRSERSPRPRPDRSWPCLNPPPDITVQLVGGDGNIYAVLGRVRRALREARVSDEEVSRFTAKATSGDYDHVLRTRMIWVNVA